MSNVITLPDQHSAILQNFIATLGQNRDRDAQTAYQTKALGIQQQQVDQTGQMEQQRIDAAKTAAQSGDAQTIAKGFTDHVITPLVNAGRNDTAAKAREAFIQANPSAGRFVPQVNESTDLDAANANMALHKKDVTGRVAAGGQDVQDRNLTNVLETTQQLSSEAFHDQVQRDPLAADAKTPYGQGAAIASGRKADAGDVLQAQTSRANTRDQITAEAPVRAAQVANYNSEIGARSTEQANTARIEQVRTDPSKASSDAKLLASYKLNPRTLDRMKPEAKRALLDEALIINPNLDLTTYDANVKTRVDFATGQAAKNIKQLNTAIRHLEEWYVKSGKLNNGFNPTINTAMNAMAEGFGSGKQAGAESSGNTIAEEFAALKKGGVPDKTEVQDAKKSFATNSSPNKRDEIKDTVGRAIIDRAAALVNQRRSVELPDDQPILSDAARTTLNRLGLDPASIMPNVQWTKERASTPGNPTGNPNSKQAAPVKYDLVWDAATKQWVQ